MKLKDTTYRPGGVSLNGPGADRKKTNLSKEAVKAALKGEWKQAAELNRAVLDSHPNDCEAANRLAKSLMELGDYTEARQILETLRVKAPGNNIARKNLARLEKLQSCGGDTRRSATPDDGLPKMFIAESGKSCTTFLRKPARSTALLTVSAGDVVSLNPRDEGVAVIAGDGSYLGAIERRLGRRLYKLMAGGNQYAAAVVGVDADGLSIILRETRQHPALRHVVSFPSALDSAPRPLESAIAAPLSEARFDEADAGMEEPEDAAEAATGSVETEASIPTDDATDEADDSDGADVPVLDDDIDAGGWTPLKPVAASDDWE